MVNLKVSTPEAEGVLQVSKSLKFQVLLEGKEMRALFNALSPCWIGAVSGVVSLQEGLIPVPLFLEHYEGYVEALKKGELPLESSLRPYFSGAISSTPEAFYARDVGKGRYLVKAVQPVVQMQAHHFFYSTLDRQFHPLVLGKESVTWGLQFSYPQIVQNPQTGMIEKVDPAGATTKLFQTLRGWMRDFTRPTPFLVNGEKKVEPIRLGKECFSWISEHPQMRAKGIRVGGRYES